MEAGGERGRGTGTERYDYRLVEVEGEKCPLLFSSDHITIRYEHLSDSWRVDALCKPHSTLQD
jgi:hypothetical protein